MCYREQGLDEKVDSSFLQTRNVFQFQQYKKRACACTVKLCALLHQEHCHKETVSLKEVISLKMVVNRNGQIKAFEIFSSRFGLLK